MKNLLLFFLLTAGAACAQDKFPKNYAIDVQHYAFDLTLSDQSDTVKGTARITVLAGENIEGFSLDLLDNMKITGVSENGKPLNFNHQGGELVLKAPALKGEERTFEIRYQGIPVSGLIIGR